MVRTQAPAMEKLAKWWSLHIGGCTAHTSPGWAFRGAGNLPGLHVPWAASVRLRLWQRQRGPPLSLGSCSSTWLAAVSPLGFSSLRGLGGYSAAQCGWRRGSRWRLLPPHTPFTFFFYVKDKGREPPQMEDRSLNVHSVVVQRGRDKENWSLHHFSDVTLCTAYSYKTIIEFQIYIWS